MSPRRRYSPWNLSSCTPQGTSTASDCSAFGVSPPVSWFNRWRFSNCAIGSLLLRTFHWATTPSLGDLAGSSAGAAPSEANEAECNTAEVGDDRKQEDLVQRKAEALAEMELAGVSIHSDMKTWALEVAAKVF